MDPAEVLIPTVFFLTVGTMMGQRHLLQPPRITTVEDYRLEVAAFEDRWVMPGLLVAGPITTLEDWQKYQQQQDSS